MSDEVGYLSAARYGKDLVRVARVVRDGDVHHVVEYTVKVMLEGDIDTSYTQADNGVVVATDSMKNTVYILAKTSPHILTPELFALHLATHFITTYKHIHKSFIDIITHKWSRIEVGGKGHGWSFVRDGEEKGVVGVVVERGREGEGLKGSVTVGLKDLLVLKTKESAFENFIRDEFTTLAGVRPSLLHLRHPLLHPPPPPSIPLTIPSLPKIASQINFPKIFATARQVTLEVFATDNSASVQATMYNTAQRLLREAEEIESASYSYPNKHYIPVNLSAFGLDNGLTREGGAEVFHPVADPSGLITATVTRHKPKSNGETSKL